VVVPAHERITRGIDNEEQIRMLAERHNEYVVDLTEDAAKATRLGLTATGRSMLSSPPSRCRGWCSTGPSSPGTPDQSSLARFLAALMSAETCRKVIVACGETGFVVRDRSAQGTILVRSVGTLERLFAQTARPARAHREGELTMRRACYTILSVAFVLAAATTHVAGQGTPRFTLAEEVIIARNDALIELLMRDPAGVRRILDAMAAANRQTRSLPPVRKRDSGRERSGDGTVVIDPLRNPDLEIFQRSSPEAAYDLFQLLKRVGGSQPTPK